MPQQENLIELLRASLEKGYVPALNEPRFEEIFLLAKQQAVTALLYPAVKGLSISPQLLKLYKEEAYSSATREALQSKELARFFAFCEAEELPVLPLKGCIIKKLYPRPELREMSDVDILVPRKKRKTVARLMAKLGNCSEPSDCADTDVFQSPLGLRYEIHFSLREDGFNPAAADFCDSLWTRVRPRADSRFLYELPPDVHYAYILCHFVKHLLYGGVGIRQLTDLYLWQKHHEMPALNKLLQELELTKFHETVQTLALHYFRGQAAAGAAQELGDYLFSSGVYGNEAQRQTDRMLRNGQGLSYCLHRIFPPLGIMKKYFPSLCYLPILLPFFWLWRILRAVLFRRRKMKTEIQLLEMKNNGELNARVAFYRRCGLSVYEEKDF